MKNFKSLSVFAMVLLALPLLPHSLQAQTVDVTIVDFTFMPADLEVEVGTTVRWTNNDAAPHTSTSDGGVWNSGTLSQGETFQYTFEAEGEYPYHCDIHPAMTATVTVNTSLAADDQRPTLPTAFSISQNYPNPFNPETTIKFNLERPAQVHLAVYNVIGQVMSTLVDEHLAAGEHSVLWQGRRADGTEASSGVYFYRITADAVSETRKMLLLR